MLSVLDLEMVPESHREQFREKLAALRDQAPTVSFASMCKVIETDIGPLAKIFTDFDETPVEFFTFGALGQLVAANNWHRIAREWLYGDPPATDIGRAVAEWEATRAPR